MWSESVQMPAWTPPSSDSPLQEEKRNTTINIYKTTINNEYACVYRLEGSGSAGEGLENI